MAARRFVPALPTRLRAPQIMGPAGSFVDSCLQHTRGAAGQNFDLAVNRKVRPRPVSLQSTALPPKQTPLKLNGVDKAGVYSTSKMLVPVSPISSPLSNL